MSEIQRRLQELNDEEMTALAMRFWISHRGQTIDDLKWTRILSRRGLVLQLWKNPKGFNWSITRLVENPKTLALSFYGVIVFSDELENLFSNKAEILKRFEEVKRKGGI